MSEGVVAVVTLVCEGDTDVAILSALAEALVPGDVIVDCVQPERPLDRAAQYGELWSGWEGVRRWCRRQCERFGDLAAAMSQPPLAGSQAVVVHIDADVADPDGLNCRKDCPPPEDTADVLRDVLLCWCNARAAPPRVVLCIPSKAIEAWVYAALCAHHDLNGEWLECRDGPESLLAGLPGKPKLVRRERQPAPKGASRRWRKVPDAYRTAAPRVAQAWPRVCKVCTQAERFDRELRAALGSPA